MKIVVNGERAAEGLGGFRPVAGRPLPSGGRAAAQEHAGSSEPPNG